MTKQYRKEEARAQIEGHEVCSMEQASFLRMRKSWCGVRRERCHHLLPGQPSDKTASARSLQSLFLSLYVYRRFHRKRSARRFPSSFSKAHVAESFTRTSLLTGGRGRWTSCSLQASPLVRETVFSCHTNSFLCFHCCPRYS